MKLKLLTIAALLPLAILSCGPQEEKTEGGGSGAGEPSTKPEVPLPDTPSVEPVSLFFITRDIHDISMSHNPSTGQYLLTTTGTDPYVFTEGLSRDLEDEHRVLSFEYRSNADTDDLQVFFGNEVSESRSRNFGPIPMSQDSWKQFDCPIAADRIAFSWGREGQFLRLDFGNRSGLRIEIRNLLLRQMTPEEAEAYENELQTTQGKFAEAERISSYLSGSYPCSVTTVTVGASNLLIRGTAGEEGDYCLADFAPWESPTEMDSFPVKVAVSGGDFSVTVPRIVSRDGLPAYDRALSRWAVVKDGKLCSQARYADAISCQNAPAALRPKSKKGLGGFYINGNLSDLDELGITSVTVNIVLNSLVNTVESGGFSRPYSYGGVRYYMNGEYVSQLDGIMSECQKRDIVVSAIILNHHHDTGSEASSLMKHPENDGGNFSMPNLTSAEAANVYAAALDFLASRYSSSTYGRIPHWIMHNEVDFAKEWTNMGDQPELRYMDSYVRSMRLCHNIAHQYDPSASVMISLTHCWSSADGQYAPKSLLEDLCKWSAVEGDFLWGVAYHPYPQDLTRPDFWKDDTRATYSDASEYCTFKNLEVINNWITNSSHFFRGTTKRLLFLSENGTNSPSYSEKDLARQAAGAAWAWKKVSALSGIDAIQWHNWQDNRGEYGLRIGLRRYPDDAEDPGGKKPAWYVWRAAGTPDEETLFAPSLDVIGVGAWSDIIYR